MVPVPPGELTLFDAQNGATVTAAVGEMISVRLSARPDTGYGWRVTSGPPAIATLSQSYDPRGGPPMQTIGPKPGQQVFRMRVAGRPGQTIKLAMVYSRPNARLALAKVYKVQIKVVPPSRS
jgi:predicted secreted protein